MTYSIRGPIRFVSKKEFSGNSTNYDAAQTTFATLTNNNLTITATSSVSYGSTRSSVGYSVGRLFCETAIEVMPNAYDAGCGITDITNIITYDSDGVVRISAGATLVDTGQTFGAGDILGFDYDKDLGTLRVRKNGGAWSASADVSFVTGKTYFSSYIFIVGSKLTTNFGVTPYTYAPPISAQDW